jgi:hypothetical protein
MKSLPVFILAFMLFNGLGAAKTPEKVPQPYFLLPGDKVPNENLSSPGPHLRDVEGKYLEREEGITPPGQAAMELFSDPGLFAELKNGKKVEGIPGKFSWHSAQGLDYCHHKDLEGNHWYGWIEGGKLFWILGRGERFWWRDAFAGHWLYYFHGDWWRCDGQTRDSIQVCVGGEYYLCDGRGKILKDMGQDGNGGIVSAPGRYRGDFHQGGSHDGSHGTGGEAHGPGNSTQGGGNGAGPGNPANPQNPNPAGSANSK